MAHSKQSFWQVVFLALFIIALAPLLHAQNTAPQYIRLAWAEDENTLRYEVLVEKEDGGVYRELLQKFTDASFIELSLAPGQYRCRVIPYDFLEKPGEESQWISFEVHAPQIPEAPRPLPVLAANRNELFVRTHSRKMFDIYVSAAWMPLFPVYGEGNPFFGRAPSLLGAALGLGALYTDLGFFSPGLELTGSWYASQPQTAERQPALRHIATAGLKLLAEIQFPNRIMAIVFHLGAGSSFLLSDDQAFHANLGASFLWFVQEHFSLEAGIDCVQMLTKDHSLCLRPALGIIWRY